MSNPGQLCKCGQMPIHCVCTTTCPVALKPYQIGGTMNDARGPLRDPPNSATMGRNTTKCQTCAGHPPDPPLAPGQKDFELWFARAIRCASFRSATRLIKLRALYHAWAWDRYADGMDGAYSIAEQREARLSAAAWRRKAEVRQ